MSTQGKIVAASVSSIVRIRLFTMIGLDESASPGFSPSKEWLSTEHTGDSRSSTVPTANPQALSTVVDGVVVVPVDVHTGCG
jgi:hypothetical protein